MTDREKLVMLLNEAHDEYYKSFDPTRDFYGMVADHLIANGVTFETDTNVGSKWIRVEDRLPDPCVSVLTLRRRLEDGKCSQRVDNIIPVYDGTFVWFSDTHSWKTKVTHWMPLPSTEGIK